MTQKSDEKAIVPVGGEESVMSVGSAETSLALIANTTKLLAIPLALAATRKAVAMYRKNHAQQKGLAIRTKPTQSPQVIQPTVSKQTVTQTVTHYSVTQTTIIIHNESADK